MTDSFGETLTQALLLVEIASIRTGLAVPFHRRFKEETREVSFNY